MSVPFRIADDNGGKGNTVLQIVFTFNSNTVLALILNAQSLLLNTQ